MLGMDDIIQYEGIRLGEAMRLASIKEREILSDKFDYAENYRCMLETLYDEQDIESYLELEPEFDAMIDEIKAMCDEICARCA